TVQCRGPEGRRAVEEGDGACGGRSGSGHRRRQGDGNPDRGGVLGRGQRDRGPRRLHRLDQRRRAAAQCLGVAAVRRRQIVVADTEAGQGEARLTVGIEAGGPQGRGAVEEGHAAARTAVVGGDRGGEGG